jgi:hypothetical protein
MVLVMDFDSADAIAAMFASDDYAELIPMRDRGSADRIGLGVINGPLYPDDPAAARKKTISLPGLMVFSISGVRDPGVNASSRSWTCSTPLPQTDAGTTPLGFGSGDGHNHCTSFRSFRRWRREGEGMSAASSEPLLHLGEPVPDEDQLAQGLVVSGLNHTEHEESPVVRAHEVGCRLIRKVEAVRDCEELATLNDGRQGTSSNTSTHQDPVAGGGAFPSHVKQLLSAVSPNGPPATALRDLDLSTLGLGKWAKEDLPTPSFIRLVREEPPVG